MLHPPLGFAPPLDFKLALDSTLLGLLKLYHTISIAI